MSAGQWLQQVTLSWLVFEMTGDPWMLGLINGLRMLPFLFTSLISGVMADRFDRRLLMLFTQTYVLVVTFLMGLALLADRAEVWHLFVFTFVSGVGWSFTMPVRQSLVPALVPRHELLNAIALSSAAFNITRFLGPAAGGFLLKALGGGGNFMVQVGFYAIVVLLIAAMRVPAVPDGAQGRAANAWKSMIEGLRYVRTNSTVMTLLILALVPMLLGMPYQSLLPIFAGDVYDIGPGGLGILIALSGLGSFLATLVVASAGDFRRKGLVQLSALAMFGVALALFGQTPWLALAIVFLMLVGAFQMTYMTINQTLLQTSITDDVRGRVMSIYMLDAGMVPAGSFAAGAIARFFGAPTTVTIMGALIAGIAVLAMIRLKEFRNL